MKRNKFNQGFTLIELMVVIAIISMLSGVILASVSSARQKAEESKAISELHSIQVAMNLFYTENNKLPTTGGNYTLPYGGLRCLGNTTCYYASTPIAPSTYSSLSLNVSPLQKSWIKIAEASFDKYLSSNVKSTPTVSTPLGTFAGPIYDMSNQTIIITTTFSNSNIGQQYLQSSPYVRVFSALGAENVPGY